MCDVNICACVCQRQRMEEAVEMFGYSYEVIHHAVSLRFKVISYIFSVSVCLSISLSSYLPTCLSVCLSAWLYFYLAVNLSVY